MALTAEQQAELRDAVKASPECADAYAARDLDTLAAIMSAGRVRPSGLEIGNGTIIDTIGLTAATAVLDVIHAQPAYKYVIVLLDQGRLKIGSTTVRDALRQLVLGGVLSQLNADKLSALGIEPNPYDRLEVEAALFDLNTGAAL